MDATAQLRAPIGRLGGVPRRYAWGSRTTIAELQGRPAPSATPEAELWFGAHASDPSPFAGETPEGDADGPTGLDRVVAADPRGTLGDAVDDEFDGQLPFLLKILAIEQPLSLQAHPSAERAVAGFRAEEARGLPRDAPERTYRDAWPKPELLCALGPVDALCGFREVPATRALLEGLAVPQLAWLLEGLSRDGETFLAEAVRRLLLMPTDERPALITALMAGARAMAAAGGPHARLADWLVRLGERYPADPGVAVASLLHLVHLHPGDAIVLPAGNLHAYLHGTAIEVMASSDNVVRGGLTTKHVDVEGLLDVLDPAPLPVPRVPPVAIDGGRAYPSGTSHFALERLAPDGRSLTLERRGPEILLAMGADVQIVADGRSLTLRSGEAAFVPAFTRRVSLLGDGPVFRVTVGELT